MVFFFPIQQELDCISDSGQILGKISFDVFKGEYVFNLADESVVLSSLEETSIAVKLAGLASGRYSIPMQDDD